MRWGFFERFQQGIECAGRQHMHFVNDIDFIARAGGTVMHAVDDLADIAHTGAAGGIHFHHVDMASLHNGAAGITDAARVGCGASAAIRADAI